MSLELVPATPSFSKSRNRWKGTKIQAQCRAVKLGLAFIAHFSRNIPTSRMSLLSCFPNLQATAPGTLSLPYVGVARPRAPYFCDVKLPMCAASVASAAKIADSRHRDYLTPRSTPLPHWESGAFNHSATLPFH
jgi:hypothetical protein